MIATILVAFSNMKQLPLLLAAFYRYVDEKFKKYYETTKLDIYQYYNNYITSLLFALYREKGIKRTFLKHGTYGVDTSSIVLLHYQSPAEYPSDPIVRLCRHLVLDTRNMAILSIGMPKTCPISEFRTHVNIPEFAQWKLPTPNPSAVAATAAAAAAAAAELADAAAGIVVKAPAKSVDESSATAPEQEQEQPHYDDEIWIEEFAERTMLICNTALAELWHIDSDAKFVEPITKDIMMASAALSTRSLIGGVSNFSNYDMPTNVMFLDNCIRTNMDIKKVPHTVLNKLCLVFNITHPLNYIAKKYAPPVYRNMLIAAYTFRDYSQSTLYWNEYIAQFAVDTTATMQLPALSLLIDNPAVIQQDPTAIASIFTEYGVILNIPRIIKGVEPLELLEYPTMSVRHLMRLMRGNPTLYDIITNTSPVGFIIKSRSGWCVSIKALKYAQLLHLRGNTPLHRGYTSRTQLFAIYWNLITCYPNQYRAVIPISLDQKRESYHSTTDFVAEFIQHFDTDDHYLQQIFKEFDALVRALITDTATFYINYFIKREIGRIPHAYYSVCRILHSEYLRTHVTVNEKIVAIYYKSLAYHTILEHLHNIDFYYSQIKSSDAKPIAPAAT